MNQTVILAMPYLYGMDRLIEKNLTHLGYTVINLCFDDRESYYPNTFSRLAAFYNRKVRKSLNYKKRLKFRRYENQFQQKLAALNGRKADYALCIRADAYPHHLIAEIRNHSNWCVNYQWDGIHRFSEITDYLRYFDRFFVFDENDVTRYPQHNLHTISNFYFDFPKAFPEPQTGRTLYFVGGMMNSRTHAIQTFAAQAVAASIELDFLIAGKQHKFAEDFNFPGIQHLTRENELSFGDSVRRSLNSLALVDFVISEHEGLSFRVFDALKFDKKLITTNTAVKKYDFYHENNIFVWHEGEPFENVTAFLERPFTPLPPEIKEKYSFSHWLQTMFAR